MKIYRLEERRRKVEGVFEGRRKIIMKHMKQLTMKCMVKGLNEAINGSMYVRSKCFSVLFYSKKGLAVKVMGANRVKGGLTEGGKRKKRTDEGADEEVLVQQIVG